MDADHSTLPDDAPTRRPRWVRRVWLAVIAAVLLYLVVTVIALATWDPCDGLSEAERWAARGDPRACGFGGTGR